MNGTNYAFDLQLQPTSVRVIVRERTTGTVRVDLTQNGNFSGSWGLYNFSQSNSIFSGLRACPLNSPNNGWYTYTPTASDADGDTLSYRKVTGPATLVVNPSTGSVHYSEPAIGTHPITVEVSDGRGGLATLSYNLVVTAPF